LSYPARNSELENLFLGDYSIRNLIYYVIALLAHYTIIEESSNLTTFYLLDSSGGVRVETRKEERYD